MIQHIRQYALWTLVIWVVCAPASRARGADDDKLDVGALAPVFTLKSINPDVTGGNTYIGLDKFVGHDATEPKKAVLLSFLASDCEPCKHEMPFLALLFDGYKDKGLQVLSVSIDKEPERIEVAHQLGLQSNVKFPILSDHFNYVARRYLVNKLPSVYLVDGDGKVSLVRVGYTEDMSKQLHEEVRKALGLSGSEPAPQALQDYLASPHTWGTAPPVEVKPAPAAAPPDAAIAPVPAPVHGKDDTKPAAAPAKHGKSKKKAKKKSKHH